MHILIGIVASVIKGHSLQWVNLMKSWGRTDTQNVIPTVTIVNTSIIPGRGKKRNHKFYQHSGVHKMAPEVHKNWFPAGNLTRMDKLVNMIWSPFRQLGQLESPWISAPHNKSNHSAGLVCAESASCLCQDPFLEHWLHRSLPNSLAIAWEEALLIATPLPQAALAHTAKLTHLLQKLKSHGDG